MEKRKGYVYLDKGKIMHVVTKKENAEERKAFGVIVEEELEHEHGYPVVNGEEIIVYSPTEMKVDATKGCIPVIPYLAELYKKCLAEPNK